MNDDLPSLSTDQLAAFVELARQGSIRAAGRVLSISEQGLRNRLVALEERVGVELYKKSRGPRRAAPLTTAGRAFLPRAHSFLASARDLVGGLDAQESTREVHVLASQYLLLYVLIAAVKTFRRRAPQIRVRLTALSERDIEDNLLRDPGLDFGVAAPYEPTTELDYRELFAMDWSLIARPRHRLLARRQVRLEAIAAEPLVIYARGSSGRQHILEAFYERGLSPRIAMEAVNTDVVVRMVEAGLGVAIVPLLPSGAITRGRRIESRPLADPIRAIHSGILRRRGEALSPAAARFLEHIEGHARSSALVRKS